MAFVPKCTIWSSNGSTLLYTFPVVQNHNAPNDKKKMIRKTNFRSQGAIIIEGGDESWQFSINFILTGVDYEAVATAIATLESTIAPNVPYLLKINITPTTYFGGVNGYKVKRLTAVKYPNRSKDLMNTKQDVTMTLQVNSW